MRLSLPDALEGRGDLDLYVPAASRPRFLEQLHAHGFVRVDTHKAYPGVKHHYGLDVSSCSFCLLHCYFRIVTGESHIKQYVVPGARRRRSPTCTWKCPGASPSMAPKAGDTVSGMSC